MVKIWSDKLTTHQLVHIVLFISNITSGIKFGPRTWPNVLKYVQNHGGNYQQAKDLYQHIALGAVMALDDDTSTGDITKLEKIRDTNPDEEHAFSPSSNSPANKHKKPLSKEEKKITSLYYTATSNLTEIDQEQAENLIDMSKGFDEGICVKMEPYKCKKEYKMCHAYYLGVCIKYDIKEMEAMCTRSKKYCCDGYKKVDQDTGKTEQDGVSLDDYMLDFYVDDDRKYRNVIAGNLEDILPEWAYDYDEDARMLALQDLEANLGIVDNETFDRGLEQDLVCKKVSLCGGYYKLDEYDEQEDQTNPDKYTVQTYGYPSYYSDDLTCDWHIQAPEGYTIELDLGVVVIEKAEGCSYDKVRVWDEINERIICGFGNPGLIRSVGRNLYVKFTSDYTEGFKGFKGHYKFVKQETHDCQAPFVWNSCPYDCQLTCADMDPFNPDRRTCYHRDKKDFIPGKSKVNCQPACACPPHLPILHTDENGKQICIVAEHCPKQQTCGIAPLQPIQTKMELEASRQKIADLRYFSRTKNIRDKFNIYGGRIDPFDIQGVNDLSAPDTILRSNNHKTGKKKPCVKNKNGKYCKRIQPKTINNDVRMFRKQPVKNHAAKKTGSRPYSRPGAISGMNLRNLNVVKKSAIDNSMFDTEDVGLKFQQPVMAKNLGRPSSLLYSQLKNLVQDDGTPELQETGYGSFFSGRKRREIDDNEGVLIMSDEEIEEGKDVYKRSKRNTVKFEDDFEDLTSDNYLDQYDIADEDNPFINYSSGKNNANLRIQGGKEASKGYWPWLGQLYDDDHLLCGLSLICTNWVLTAAHCFYVPKSGHMRLEPSRYRIRLGRNERSGSIDEAGSQNFVPARIFTHPDYSAAMNLHDIAVVALPQAARISDYVRPICLPELLQHQATEKYLIHNLQQDRHQNYRSEERLSNESLFNSKGANADDYCWIAGWGRNKEGKSQPKLKDAIVAIRPIDTCQKLYLYSFPEAQICAGGHSDRDSCVGDSGGPLMCMSDEFRHSEELKKMNPDLVEDEYGNLRKVWTVQGVTSFGSDCGSYGKPGGYTRINHYVSWIENIIGTGCTKTFRDHL